MLLHASLSAQDLPEPPGRPTGMPRRRDYNHVFEFEEARFAKHFQVRCERVADIYNRPRFRLLRSLGAGPIIPPPPHCGLLVGQRRWHLAFTCWRNFCFAMANDLGYQEQATRQPRATARGTPIETRPRNLGFYPTTPLPPFYVLFFCFMVPSRRGLTLCRRLNRLLNEVLPSEWCSNLRTDSGKCSRFETDILLDAIKPSRIRRRGLREAPGFIREAPAEAAETNAR